MSSAAAPCLAGVRAALVEVSEAEDTPRALLRGPAALEASVRRLDLAALGAGEDSLVDLVAGAAVAGASAEVIVVASEEDSAAVVAVAAAALGTKDRMATARPTVLLPVLEDHGVGSAETGEVTGEVTVEAIAAATVMAATDVEEAIEVPAVPTTNHSAEIATTTATAAAGTIRGNERTRAIATTTGASAGGTSLYARRFRFKMGLSRLSPISSFCLLRQRG